MYVIKEKKNGNILFVGIEEFEGKTIVIENSTKTEDFFEEVSEELVIYDEEFLKKIQKEMN